jgi:hypothetical protein
MKVYRRDLVPADMATGRAWLKFKPQQGLVWIDDVDGRPRWITDTQARLLAHLRTLPDGSRIVMRELAEVLEVAPSTVSRGMVKLASFGRLHYRTGRGRYTGTIVWQGLIDVAPIVASRLREVAKAKVRAWAQAASDRVSRLKINVAANITWKEMEAHGLEGHYLLPMVATLKRPWTVEELREAGIV